MSGIPTLTPPARALADHQRTSGMAVSMGWTCQCGFYADNLAEQYEHQVQMVIEAALNDKELPPTKGHIRAAIFDPEVD